ncbi:MAG: ATP-binding protein [Planctomycetota bacterium]
MMRSPLTHRDCERPTEPHRYIAAAVLLALCLLAPRALGQRYHVHTYTAVDGLPSTSAYDVVQDAEGLLWFSTRAGVTSYDGGGWRGFGPDDGLTLETNGLLEVASDGALWVAARHAPLAAARWDGEAWTETPRHALRGSVGVVAFAVDAPTGAAYVALGSHGLWCHADGAWSQVMLGGERTAAKAIEVFGRDLYVGTGDGLLRLPLDDGSPRAVPIEGLPAGPVRALAAEPGRLWVASSDWLARGDGERFTLHSTALPGDGPKPHLPVALEPDGAGGALLGSIEWLAWTLAGGEARRLGLQSGLLSVGAAGIHRDREGNLWIASPRGVSKIVSRRFESWTAEHGLFEDEVTAVLERADGTIVLGHGGGLTFLGDEPRTITFEGGTLESRVMDLVEDSAGTLWVAASLHGLLELAPNGEARWHRRSRPAYFSALHATGPGELWVGTGTALLRYSHGFFEDLGLSGPQRLVDRRLSVRRLEGARDGGTFIATAGSGLMYRGPDRDGGELWHWRAKGRARSTYCVSERPGGELWVGTSAGLHVARRDGKTLEPLELDGRVVDSPVYFLLDGPAGETWIGTDHGVQRLDPDGLRSFGPESGLAGLETNRDAAIVDRDGAVWIGTEGGVSVYDPRRDPPPAAGPALALLSLESGGTEYPLSGPRAAGGAIELASNAGLVIRFSAISFVDETRVSFEYRIDGLDGGWTSPAQLPTRELRIASLAPGAYRLHLRATDVNGEVSATATSPELIVRGPLWTRPWFVALGVLLVALVVGGRVRLAAERRHGRSLELEVRRRTAQLADSERAVRADRERLAVTLARIADGVVTTDSERRVVLWNRAAEIITGRAADDVRGLPLARALGAVDDSADGSPAGPGELAIESVGGTRRWIELSEARLLDGAEASVTVFRDTTERRARETDLARQQRLEALGILAGGIAHDFNNYLTVILGTVGSMLRVEELSPEVREELSYVENATDRARSLTQQLLTFSKGGTPVRKAVSLERVVRDTTSFALSGSGVRGEVTIEEDLWNANADEGQVAEVLHNLLLNARQAMNGSGCVHVRVRNHAAEPDGEHPQRSIEVEVEDEGPGIPAEDQARIFDPFFTRRKGGSGLGLAVAYSVVKRHAGSITVESVEGRGALFRLRLPASAGESGSAELPRPRAPHPSPGGGLARVLVMDDEPDVRAVATRILEHGGYLPSTATHGEEAVKLYSAALAAGAGFDAVLMDLTVAGGMGGREATDRLLALDPDARVIAMSGYSNDEVLAEYRRFGFCARLPKPFRSERLLEVLGDVLTEADHATEGAGPA